MVFIKYRIDQKKSLNDNEKHTNNLETDLTSEIDYSQKYDTNTVDLTRDPRKDSVAIYARARRDGRVLLRARAERRVHVQETRSAQCAWPSGRPSKGTAMERATSKANENIEGNRHLSYGSTGVERSPQAAGGYRRGRHEAASWSRC